MVVNLLWRNYLKQIIDGDINETHSSNQNLSGTEGYEFNSEKKYNLNATISPKMPLPVQTPNSNQTYKYDNRRKLNMNSEVPTNL